MHVTGLQSVLGGRKYFSMGCLSSDIEERHPAHGEHSRMCRGFFPRASICKYREYIFLTLILLSTSIAVLSVSVKMSAEERKDHLRWHSWQTVRTPEICYKGRSKCSHHKRRAGGREGNKETSCSDACVIRLTLAIISQCICP